MNAIQLDGITQHYGATAVLHDLSLHLPPGEVLGLFGHNGAGKTTTIKLILGLLQPTQGQVQVLGGSPQDVRIKLQIGYLPENVMFYPQLSGRETLRHFARLKQAPDAQVSRLLDQVGLSTAADRRVKTYSKGMRQRLGLAQALLGKPRLLLLDEPTVGLDPIATQTLYRLIDTLRAQGTSVILCSHVLPGVEAYIDRAAILSQGRVQAAGTLADLRAQAALPVRIRASGLRDPQRWHAHWQSDDARARRVNAHGLEVSVRAAHKLAVLRTLMDEDAPRELDVHLPSLEDLYCHFARLAGQEDAHL